MLELNISQDSKVVKCSVPCSKDVNTSNYLLESTDKVGIYKGSQPCKIQTFLIEISSSSSFLICGVKG